MPEGIEIKISKKGAPGTEGMPDAKKDSEPGKPSSTQKQVNTLLVNYGKQSLQEGYKLITDFSGDYVTANRIDTVLNIAADISTIATGGWVGAIAVGFKYTTQSIEQTINLRREQNRIQTMNQMLGEITQLGGRYTNA